MQTLREELLKLLWTKCSASEMYKDNFKNEINLLGVLALYMFKEEDILDNFFDILSLSSQYVAKTEDTIIYQ